MSLGFAGPKATAQTDNQASFEAYLKTVYDAYASGGYDQLKKYYAPTASEIGPDGRLVAGLQNLQAAWLELDKMLDGKPKFTYHLTSWRLLKPDVAIITWDSDDEFQIHGQIINAKSTASAFLRKENGHWLIEFDQLTPKVDLQADPSMVDKAGLNELSQEIYAAFGAFDAARFAKGFTEDVYFIPPHGQPIHGREALEQAQAELFKAWKDLPPSQVETSDFNLRFLSPDVVVCQWSQKTIRPGAAPETSSLLNVCQHQNGKWLVSAMSITPTVSIPGLQAKN